MTLSTNSLSDVGSYPITLTVSLPSYPPIAPITKKFLVTIICEITGYTVVKALPLHSTYTI